MTYQVLARKWRPRTFQQMVGQPHILKALTHALDHQRIHHAYLFTGTRGVGKTTIARIFAKCVNCEQGTSACPCGTCAVCKAVDEGRFVDLIEIDAASRTKVEDTRELLENVPYLPSQGRVKVYLIDEVHMLSNHSFNALLKTLEEPPAHVKFILATTDPQRLPPTILSRCLQFHLKGLAQSQIEQHLSYILQQEGIFFEEPALSKIARAAEGSMRDALSLLEQVIAAGEGKVLESEVFNLLGLVDANKVIRLLNALLERDAQRVVACIQELDDFHPDYEAILGEMLLWLQRASWYQINPQWVDSLLQKDVVKALASKISAEILQLFYQIALLGRKDLSLAPDPKSGFEMVMLRMMAFLPVQPEPIKVSANVQTPPPLTLPHKGGGDWEGELQNCPPSPCGRGLGGGEREQAPVPPIEKRGLEPAPENPLIRGGILPPPPQDFNWNDLVPKLNLTGIPKLLVSHCVFQRKEKKNLYLAIAPPQAPLLNDRLRLIIEKAVMDALGEIISLKIEVGKVAEQTPASAAKKTLDEERSRVIQEIEADQNVQTLLQKWGGQIQYENISVREK